MKKCIKCKVLKDETLFWFDRSQSDDRSKYCGECKINRYKEIELLKSKGEYILTRRGISKPLDFILDNTFLTEDEIKSYYKYMNRFLWNKFRIINEEYTQLAIIKAMEKSYQFDPIKSKKVTWMTTILKNIVLEDRMRDSKTVSLDNIISGEFTDTTYIEQLVDDSDIEEIPNIDYIESLTYMFPYLQLKKEGKTYKEISEIMGVEIGYTKTKIHQDRRKLRKYIMNNGSQYDKELISNRISSKGYKWNV